MKREDLKKIKVDDKELTDDVVNEIMKLYNASIKEKDETITTLTTERDSYKTSLDDTKSKLDELSKSDENIEKVKEELANLQTKYDTDTNNLKSEISKNKYDSKVRELTSELKFSSESAKKSFIRDLSEKGLKLEDDKILGFDDFVNSYKEQDPSAFAKEKDTNDNNGISVNTGSSHDGTPSNETMDLKAALKEHYKK